MNTIVLFNPEIPHNTGAIARTCAITHTQLHLVGTLGFELSDKYLKRAGMDYWHHVDYTHFTHIDAYMDTLDMTHAYLYSTKATAHYHCVTYPSDCIMCFGNETSGTPAHIQAHFTHMRRVLRIPMVQERRSMNLAISTGIVLYEVLRQQGFVDLV